MKTFSLTALIVFSQLFTSSDPLTSLRKLELKNYVKTSGADQITFGSTDTLILYCCALNPLYIPLAEDSFLYRITIRYEKKMPKEEITRRRHLQDSLLKAYKAVENQRNTHHLYHNFIISKNVVDSLSIPYKNRTGYSIFISDNLELYGYHNLIIDDLESIKTILAIRKQIFQTLNIPYQEPAWLYEYAPALSENFMKGNTGF